MPKNPTEQLYCATFSHHDSTAFIPARIQRDGYGSTPYAWRIEDAAIGPKSRIELKATLMTAEFGIEGVRVRPLSAKELRDYQDARRSADEWRAHVGRVANLNVRLSEDGEVVTFYTKRRLNAADRAALEIFAAIGLTVRELDDGTRYVAVRRPRQED